MGEGKEEKTVQEMADDMKAFLTSTTKCLQTRCQISDDSSFLASLQTLPSEPQAFTLVTILTHHNEIQPCWDVGQQHKLPHCSAMTIDTDLCTKDRIKISEQLRLS